MTKTTDLYATAHSHCVALLTEIQQIPDAPPELALLLSYAAMAITRARTTAFNKEHDL